MCIRAAALSGTALSAPTHEPERDGEAPVATRLHAVLAVGEAGAVHAVQRSRTLSHVELHAPTPQCLDVHVPAAQDRQGDDEVAVRRVVMVQLAGGVARGVRHLSCTDDELAQAGRGKAQHVVCEGLNVVQQRKCVTHLTIRGAERAG